MNKVLKISWSSGLGALALVVLIGLNAWQYQNNLPLTITWGIAGLLWLIHFIRRMRIPVYIIINDGTLTLHEGRKPHTVTFDDIQFIKMNYNPFTKSYFQLKDGRQVRFSPSSLSDKDADSLKEICADVRG